MKLWKPLLALSLLANIAFIFAWRQKMQTERQVDEQLKDMLQRTDGLIQKEKQSTAGLRKIRQDMHDQDLQMTAFDDQTEAFIEEYSRYAH